MSKPEVTGKFPPSREVAPVNVHITLAHEGARNFVGDELSKKDKAEVDYRLSGNEDNCFGCRFSDFATEAQNGRCSKVAGEIRRAYVCDLYASRTRDPHGH